MKTITIRQVDAFTTTPHTGNPAGVVLDAGGLSESQMQTIAREMNLSETAFILPPTRSGAEVRIRWFTPTVEVPLCGHATIAGFHALAEEKHLGMAGPGTYSFNLETAGPVLPVSVELGAGSCEVSLGLGLPEFEKVPHLKVDLVRLLGIPAVEFDNRVPILRNTYLYVFIKRLHTLFTLKPNFLNISSFLTSRNLTGICIYTLETIDRDSSVHSRFFAPNCGINEDPVTGSSHGPLGAILYDHGLLNATGESVTFVGEQGDAIGRRGRVKVNVAARGGKAVSVRIGGPAVTVLRGDMIVHE
ncbi:MAG TPA: PhzF family phenazine biosynthesis protein [Bacteroidota bacterium]|nr:PhzF family phenazine biosynthesis protein [Bacteroidota bacterium]